MHEMSITASLVDVCEQHSGGRRVTAVTLEIGDLSGILPESVEFCFDVCTQDTLLEGAKLLIERVPAVARCLKCGRESAVSTWYDPCPACGSYRVAITTGEELRVKELEVE